MQSIPFLFFRKLKNISITPFSSKKSFSHLTRSQAGDCKNKPTTKYSTGQKRLGKSDALYELSFSITSKNFDGSVCTANALPLQKVPISTIDLSRSKKQWNPPVS